MYEKIKELCRANNISVNKLEQALGFAKGSLCRIDVNKPSVDKLQKIAKYFNVGIEYLTGEEKESSETYYLNDDARELAQFMFENPEYKVLFDASRKVKKEDIEFVKQMIDRMRGDSDYDGC